MLYACGSNGSGQLGLSHCKDIDVFTAVPGVERADQVAGGGNHTLILSDGHVFGSGAGTAGQLPTSSSKFVEIIHPENRKWVAISAGWEFSILVDDAHQIWSAGKGPKGELASEMDHGLAKVWTFAELVTDIKSSMAHTLVLLESGEVWGWGASRKGQLNVLQTKVVSPQLVCTGAQEIAVGRDFSLALSNGSLLVFGNFKGDVPAIAHHIYAGWSSIATVGSYGLRMSGNNSHGQLNGPSSAPTRLAAGSEHYIGILDNKIITWGWGEHGNCPEPIYTRSGAESSGKPPKVFAGCATSFYVSDTSYQ